MAGRFFSSTSTDPRGPLSVRKRDALCCPDFPLALWACTQGPAADRPAVLLCCLRDVASAVHAAPAGGPDCPLSSAKVQRKTIHSLGLQRKVVSFLSCAAPRGPEKRVPEAPLMLVSAAFQSCSCAFLESFLRCFRTVPAVFRNCSCSVSELFLWRSCSVSCGELCRCSYPMSLLSRICRLFAPILVKECKSRGSECLTMVNEALCSVK